MGCMAEAEHYVKEVATGKQQFALTSCCPSWSVMAKNLFPETIDKISNELTPMVATARLIKQEHPDASVVFIGPCASKKLEASRRTVRSDVDFVITFEELTGMFEAKGILLDEIKAMDEMKDATAAGRGYGVAGGVANAINTGAAAAAKGGGREHAIATCVAKSPKVDKIYCAPGNAGIGQIAECVPIGAMEFDKIVTFAKEQAIDLTIVGMDDPLVGGLVDALEAEGLRAFGPRKNAAILEGSKAFSKDLMKKYNIPTAAYENFDNAEEAIKYLKEQASFPIVLKADGLALGKGVLICNTLEEALAGVDEIMLDKKFGAAGNRMEDIKEAQKQAAAKKASGWSSAAQADGQKNGNGTVNAPKKREEQKELMNLIENYKDQLSDWELQNKNQQRQLNDYLSSDAGMLQREINKLRKHLEKVEADNFNEMIQRRNAEEIAETWKRIAEKGGSRKGV